MLLVRVIGFAGVASLILVAMGDVTIFLDIPSLLIVVGLTVWGFLAEAGPRTVKALRAALVRAYSKTEI